MKTQHIKNWNALLILMFCILSYGASATATLPSDLLLPQASYNSAVGVTTNWPSGFQIRNVHLHNFTNQASPPALGNSEFHSTSSSVELEISTNGGASFIPVITSTALPVLTNHTSDAGATRNFVTEMLSLNLSGGGMPPGVMIRESPTLNSHGQTSIQPNSGQFQIDSFFDVFVEMSLDGGQTWGPATAPMHIVLQPVSSSIPTLAEWGLIAFGGLLLISGALLIRLRG